MVILLHVSLVQHNLLLFEYSLNDEQTGQLCIPGSFSVHRMSGLYLCHIIIQSCPTWPLSSLPVVPKGGGQCECYSCRCSCNMTLCSGCWWLLHGVCPWDDCFVQGHCMYAVCVCVKRIFAGSLYLGREQASWNTGQQSPYPVRQQSLSSGCVVQSMCAEFPC